MRLLLSLLFFIFSTTAQGAIVQINGKWSDDRYAPKFSIAEHFDLGKNHFQKGEWKEANQNFMIICLHFPESSFYGEAFYLSGVCYFELKDYDRANQQFSNYLNHGSALQYFEKAFSYKFEIAEAFAKGKKKHLFGFERMPKLWPARKDSLAIYDEIISALPSKDLGLRALYGKAKLLKHLKQYKESIETLSTLVRRFPKTSLAAQSYLLISDIYLDQAQLESQNPDFVSLAKINLQRFQKSFPGDERVAVVEENVKKMEEIYASTLYDVACFYEKKRKPKAALVYYQEAVSRYPGTEGARKSMNKMKSTSVAQK